MKKAMKKLVGILLATTMLSAIAVPSYANEEASEEGCGNSISYAGRLGVASGGNCREQGGPSNCINSVWIDAYTCNPSCHGAGGYCGAIYVCSSGHVIKNVGQVMGYC